MTFILFSLVTIGLFYIGYVLIFLDDFHNSSSCAWKHIFLSSSIVVLCMVGLFWSESHMEEYNYKINIYSGYNKPQTEGSFFLGTGTIEEKDYVYFWIKDSKNALRKYSYAMSISSFIEDGGNYIIVTRRRCEKEWTWLCGSSEKPLVDVEFHIPEGSIYNMYQFK